MVLPENSVFLNDTKPLHDSGFANSRMSLECLPLNPEPLCWRASFLFMRELNGSLLYKTFFNFPSHYPAPSRTFSSFYCDHRALYTEVYHHVLWLLSSLFVSLDGMTILVFMFIFFVPRAQCGASSLGKSELQRWRNVNGKIYSLENRGQWEWLT